VRALSARPTALAHKRTGSSGSLRPRPQAVATSLATVSTRSSLKSATLADEYPQQKGFVGQMHVIILPTEADE
jgi:hypothetical protein